MNDPAPDPTPDDTPADTQTCCYCGTEYTAERPYPYCMERVCRDTAMIARRADMSVQLIPKVGFTYTFKDDGTRWQSGKSSGR